MQKENPYKVKAYRRAAGKIRTLSDSIDELVREHADLTEFAGIGEAISSAIREIVRTGTLGKLEKLRSQASPELKSISDHPRLDPRRILRIYKKLNISSVGALREKLESGDSALFALSSGILLRIQLAYEKDWGLSLIACTGSKAHLRKLTAITGSLRMLRSEGSSFPSEDGAVPEIQPCLHRARTSRGLR